VNDALLSVRNLSVGFSVDGQTVAAIERISFDLAPGKTLGLVGESGSGKSVTALSLMRLIPPEQGKFLEGTIQFRGQDVLRMDARSIRRLRGNRISMIFQEPMTSLNPLFTVGFQIGEVLRLHQRLRGQILTDRTIALLNLVRIPSPEQKIHEFPHQLSGGLRQRVMIAMALACRPELLIADEPTTALDVTIQAQILDLMKNLQAEIGMAILLITHDLGVVGEVCEHVAVMYGGRIVEMGPVAKIFAGPLHPYTEGLLLSRPRLGQRKERLDTIKGQVPAIGQFPAGCRFQDRCPKVMERCRLAEPPLRSYDAERQVACWLHDSPRGHT